MERKIVTAEVKAEILCELLESQVSASDLIERYGVNINSIYNWRKQLFEGAAAVLGNRHEKASEKTQTEIAKLQHQLREKDGLIAELVQDNITLKQRTIGPR
ncbi:MAG: transposase [Ignavibacteriae bacterium]|nr:transposase [Ignavibacteriota bacterium]